MQLARERALRASAGVSGWQPRALPRLALAVGVDAQRKPGALLEACVRVSLGVHPLLEQVLIDQGARRTGVASYALGLREHDAVVAALRAVGPGRVVAPAALERARAGKSLAEQGRAWQSRGVEAELGRDERAARAAQEAGWGERGARKSSGAGWVVLSVSGGQIRLRIHEPVWELTAGVLNQLSGTGAGEPLLLVPSIAAALVRELNGVVVACDTSPGAGLSELLGEAAAALLADRVPGSPGLARLSVPEEATDESDEDTHTARIMHTRQSLGVGALAPGEHVLSAPAALAEVVTRHLSTPVAVHPRVLDAAEMAAAGPAGREGLRPWQDHFVSTYLATQYGAVCALEPGMGKTVCAASALAERARLLPSSEITVVSVPAGLREQWRGELTKFFPEAQLHVIESGAELRAAAEKLSVPGRVGPAVLVLSHELAAREAELLTGLELGDIVVDEAAILRNSGVRSEGLWALRAAARRGLALTGTPVERGLDDLARILGWCRGERDLAEQAQLEESLGGLGRRERHQALERWAGASVFSAPVELAQLPSVRVESVVLTPSPEEAQALSSLRERTRKHLDELTQAQAAHRAGVSGAGVRLREQRLRALGAVRSARVESLSPGGGRTKLNWSVERAVAASARGEQVLIACDVLSAAPELVSELGRRGVSARALSGELRPGERAGVVAAFDTGNIEVLVLSSVGRLGLNLQAAAEVICHDIPDSLTTLQQRVARAARMGGARREVRLSLAALEGGAECALLEGLRPALERIAAGGSESEFGSADGDQNLSELVVAWARAGR